MVPHCGTITLSLNVCIWLTTVCSSRHLSVSEDYGVAPLVDESRASAVAAKPNAGVTVSTTALCSAECQSWTPCLELRLSTRSLFLCLLHQGVFMGGEALLHLLSPGTGSTQVPPRRQCWWLVPSGHTCGCPWSTAGVPQSASFPLPILHRDCPLGYSRPPYGRQGPASTGASAYGMHGGVQYCV